MSSSSPPTPTETETLVVNSNRETQRLEEAREARRAGLRWRRITRWLGLAFFVFGSALLIYVFLQALSGLARLAQPGALNDEFNRQAGQSTDTAKVVQAVVSVFGAEFLYRFIFADFGFHCVRDCRTRHPIFRRFGVGD